MHVTVKDLRDLIDGLPEDTRIDLVYSLSPSTDELAAAELVGVEMGADGTPRIVITLDTLDPYGDDEDDDEDRGDPVGSCDECGCAVYAGDTFGVCDHCYWSASCEQD